MEISELKKIFEKIWCRETSAYPDIWTKENSACGQCLSTSMIAQDVFGGRILMAAIDKEVHFWNLLPDGERDFTASQLPTGLALPKGRVISRNSLEEYGEMFPRVSERYHLLVRKFSLHQKT